MIDTNAILDAMERCAAAELKITPGYPKQGLLVVTLRSKENPDQWESLMRFFGKGFRGPRKEQGKAIDTGCNFDAVVHEKIAYTRRTGKNSGADIYDLCGEESRYQGAVIASDGRCICAFSGLPEAGDLKIAEAGIAEYEKHGAK
jgi:hypothetical protein